SYDLDLGSIYFQIDYGSVLSEVEVCYVELKAGRNVSGQTLDLDLAKVDFENAALEFDPDRLSNHHDRNADPGNYGHRESHQIGMTQPALDRIRLPVLDDQICGLANARYIQLEYRIWPVSERSRLARSLAFTATGTESSPSPYTEAGIMPWARSRLAGPLPTP